MRVLLAAGLLGCVVATAPAQGVLDLMDGETLYEGGSLVTLGFEYDRGDRLRRGTRRVADPGASQEASTRSTLAYQFGLRHDLQVGVALPYASHERIGTGGSAEADGIGDLDLLAKWRFYRFDALGVALNVSALGALSLPTGADDATANGLRLEPELQPGSGGVDPALGIGVTHEPERWRFNAAALYRWRTDTDSDDTRLGDELVCELAAGNRFWLEPYPGPVPRASTWSRATTMRLPPSRPASWRTAVANGRRSGSTGRSGRDPRSTSNSASRSRSGKTCVAPSSATTGPSTSPSVTASDMRIPTLALVALLGACAVPSADPIPRVDDFAFVQIQLRG
ncbi:MAG: transporter [Phycisphaerales bacterium]|nr:transporter [Phycisphaerales bacterium]